MHESTRNVDPAELAKFTALAQSWWDPKGPSKPLHDLNPLASAVHRTQVGPCATNRCSTSAAAAAFCPKRWRAPGARVLGIDLSQAVLDVAELHALEAGIPAVYRQIAAEELAQERPAAFDLVTCMEMLEHVPDPAAIVKALAALVKPGGDVIVSTLNRNPLAFAVAIVGAEYIARVLPRGTHEYLKFIRPSELARWGRNAGLELRDLTGITYNPFTRSFRLSPNTDVNYLAHFSRPR